MLRVVEVGEIVIVFEVSRDVLELLVEQLTKEGCTFGDWRSDAVVETCVSLFECATGLSEAMEHRGGKAWVVNGPEPVGATSVPSKEVDHLAVIAKTCQSCSVPSRE